VGALQACIVNFALIRLQMSRVQGVAQEVLKSEDPLFEVFNHYCGNGSRLVA
jgi:hypothetical protein